MLCYAIARKTIKHEEAVIPPCRMRSVQTAVFAAATELIRTQSPPILTTPLILSHVNLLEARTGHYVSQLVGDGVLGNMFIGSLAD